MSEIHMSLHYKQNEIKKIKLHRVAKEFLLEKHKNNTSVVVVRQPYWAETVNIDIQDILSKMKKVRNSQRYTNFPIPSTRKSKVTIPEVESSALDDYKSYPMPDYLWSKFINVYQESKKITLGNTKCFEIIPASEDELSLFPTGLSNEVLRDYLFKKMNSTRKQEDGFDYREISIESEPLPGASMYKSLITIDAEDMQEASVRTLFTKDSTQAFNQVLHDTFIDVLL